MNSIKSIIFAGYRSWAVEIFNRLQKKHPHINWHLADNQEKLKDMFLIEDVEVVVLAGWSWILNEEQVNSKMVIGLHPSDLPDYAGGSPIQNQILDGLIDSRMTLFKLNAEIDTGDLIYKESMSLAGSMQEVFQEMTRSGMCVLERFILNYPDIKLTKQAGVGKKCRRLKPSMSKISRDLVQSMTNLELYNFIRCRQDPYPNVFLEDETGKLFFKDVKFEAKT